MTESERAGFEEVLDEAHAEELRVAAVRGMEERLAGFSAHKFLPVRLSGRRADEVGVGCLGDEAFEKLRQWVQQHSDAVDARHPARDAAADSRGYSELYARHWQDKALDQQRGETEGRALGGTAGFCIRWMGCHRELNWLRTTRTELATVACTILHPIRR